jgi:hypothetical protein
MRIIRISYRDHGNRSRFDDARVQEEGPFPLSGKKVLLIDDVSRSGQTLARARENLARNAVKTFLVNGKADSRPTIPRDAFACHGRGIDRERSQFSGSFTLNSVNCPGVLVKVMIPLCASAMCWHIERPRPAFFLFIFVLKKGLKILPWMSAGIP